MNKTTNNFVSRVTNVKCIEIFPYKECWGLLNHIKQLDPNQIQQNADAIFHGMTIDELWYICIDNDIIVYNKLN